MVYCSNCGKDLNPEDNFCLKCGTRTEKGVKEGVAVSWMSDVNWRQDIDSALQKASKAIDDGVKVARDSLHEVAQEVEKGVRNAREGMRERTGPVFCKNCGTQNTRYAKFCVKCGKEL
jgi:uncharacterized membrane protein YvbJ